MSATAVHLVEVAEAGEIFLAAIEHTGALPLSHRQRDALIDEIDEWIIRIRAAQEFIERHAARLPDADEPGTASDESFDFGAGDEEVR